MVHCTFHFCLAKNGNGYTFKKMLAASNLPPLFSLLAIMFIAVVVVSLLLLKVQRSLLVAYFLCGVIIANSGVLHWLGGEEQHLPVGQISEIGIMLLMFVLGMEFSVRELKFLRRFALSGGGVQMAVCGAVAAIIAVLAGLGWPAAIIIGSGFAMSSTAVSLKSFQDMSLSNSAGARFALGIAIFQDLFIIAFLVFLPLLTHSGASTENGGETILKELGILLVRGSVFVLIAWVAARWIIPATLQNVARTRIRELFTLAVVGFCIGLAWIGGLLQLSLALGAFVAGLAVSESVFKHRILADITPIKDVFLTLFFVSIGLIVDLSVAFQNIWIILLLTSVLIVSKSALIFGIAIGLGQDNRTSLLGAFSLCSAGEFSLLLFQKAGRAGLWNENTQQCLIASAALSMALVPGLMKLASPVGRFLDRKRWGRLHSAPEKADAAHTLSDAIKSLRDHAVVCGFGPVGQSINRSLLEEGIPTLIVELNVKTVQELTAAGQPVLFADASHEETWELAGLDRARLVAFTMPDAAAVHEGLRIVREMNPEICILARARFTSDRDELESLGASVVLHDEYEVARAGVENVLRLTNVTRPPVHAEEKS